MTAPYGGTGSSNLGTAYARVRVDYESSGAVKATKDVEALQNTLINTGTLADKSARQFEKAQAQVIQSAQRADQVLKKGVNVSAPINITPREVRLDTAAITKAIEDFKGIQRSALKVSVPIHISPSKVDVDRGAVTRTLDNFSRAYGSTRIGIKAAVDVKATDITINRSGIQKAIQATELDRIVLRTAIRIEPTEVTIDQSSLQSKAQQAGPITLPGQVSQGGSGLGAGLVGGALGRGGAGLLGRLASMGPAVAGIGAIGAAAAVAAPAVGALTLTLTKGFGRLQGLDQAAIKLKALGRSTEEIAAISDSALLSVEGTAFGLDEAFNVAANALASGLKPGKQLDDYLGAVAGTAALAGTSMVDMGSAFNSAAVQGRLTGDIMQLLYARQVPVLQLLAEEYDVTQAKAQQMVSNGEVNFDRFIAAMGKNGEAAKEMGNTVSGSFSNLMASVSRIGAMLLAPLFGEATGEASNMAKMIQNLTDRLKSFEGTLRENRETIVNFWAAFGKGAIVTGHLITATISSVTGLFGVVMKGTSWLVRAFGEIKGFAGDEKTKRLAIGLADGMSDLGNSSFETTGKIWGFNKTLDEMGKGLDKWREKETAAKESTDEVGISFDEAAKEAVPLEQALEGLQVKSETVEKSIKGTNEELRELIKTLKQKGAGDDLLKNIMEIRRQYETAGRPVDNFAKAIDRLADSTVSADQKAQDFIRTLREMNELPSGNALADFNDMWREMFAFDANHVDPLGALGDLLLNSDSTINTMQKNGSTLLRLMNELIAASTTLVTSGEASPEEAYQRATQGLQELLRQFGITDPNVVNDIVSQYFPENWFVDAIKKGGDPRGALEAGFRGDPIKLDSMLKILTTTEQILGQVLGPDGVLRVPTVLDVQGELPTLPTNLGANTPNDQIPPEGVSVPGGPVKPGFEMRKFPDGSYRAVPVVEEHSGPKEGFTPESVSEAIKRWEDGQKGQPEEKGPEKPWYRDFLPGIFRPDTGKMGGGHLYQWPGDRAFREESLTSKELEALKDTDLTEEIMAQDYELMHYFQMMQQKYVEQGKTLADAYAEGIMSEDEKVREAIKKLASIAADGLGHSPAKYGPLSGRGWVYFRGQTFTEDWASGIVSQASSVQGAVTAVASKSVETFDEKWTRRVSDMQELSDLGKMILDFGNQLSDIAFGSLEFLNNMSFGALFPKQYKRDPNARARDGNQFFGGEWSPQGWEPPKTIAAQGTSVNITAQPSRLKDTGSVPSGPLSRQAAAIVEQFWGDQMRGTIGGSRDSNTAKGTHDKGLSIDIPIGPDQMALGDEIAKYFLDNAEDLGVKYTIWRNEGRYPSDPTKVGFTADGHFNHIDVHFKESPEMGQGLGPSISFNTPQSANKGQRSSSPTSLPTNAGQQDIANYIMSKAMSEGFSRDQAENFVVQAFGESHLSPTAYNPAGWSGIFQFDESTWKQAGGGDVLDAKQNIDNYFNLARQRGLTPESFSDPKQLGTQVSIGGPLHPENIAKGHLTGAIQGAAPFIANAPGSSSQNPLNVILPQRDSKALQETGWNTQNLQTMPDALRDLASREPLLQQALARTIASESDAIASLQRIDSLIEEQNQANTPQSKRMAEDLGKIHSNLKSSWGLQEQPSALEQSQTIVSGISSIASEALALVDQAITSVAAGHEITSTLVRGVSNTEDINNIIDSAQEFITLFQRGFQLASNTLGFAASMVGMAGAADPSGGAAGAAGGIGAAGAITGVVAQVLGAVNTAIDIGQEVYSIGTKYLGRALTSWFGLSGANDIRYLLDEVTGQMHVYSSENPLQRSTFNTLGRSLGASYPERQAPTNYFTIYQGPGQDPRDTMDDAMFSIRASGIGAFGYAD